MLAGEETRLERRAEQVGEVALRELRPKIGYAAKKAIYKGAALSVPTNPQRNGSDHR